MADLFVDITEEFVSLSYEGKSHITNISTEKIWDHSKNASKQPIFKEAADELKSYLVEKEYSVIDELILSVPVKDISYQIITLPEDIDENDRLILLGLEIDKAKITSRFIYSRLHVTKRIEEGQTLCDYIVMSLKPGHYEKLAKFFKALGLKIGQVVPSFLLMAPNGADELTASAYVASDRTELVIWGQDVPLALTDIANEGDQMKDINNFITEYFDQFGNLELSKIRLYGPRMQDESITFSLSYPNEILSEPRLALSKSLERAKTLDDISVKTKLPSPPMTLTPRNMAYIGSAAVAALLILVSLFFYTQNLILNNELNALRTKAEASRKLLLKSQKMSKEQVELEKEKEFYLNITKRRTPWHTILVDLARLTPKELWFERLSSTKASLQLAGKAVDADSVSDLSINLNNSSKYFKDAQLLGVRDFEQDRSKLAEFQVMVKLDSPQ